MTTTSLRAPFGSAYVNTGVLSIILDDKRVESPYPIKGSSGLLSNARITTSRISGVRMQTQRQTSQRSNTSTYWRIMSHAWGCAGDRTHVR